jgi:hypothetical protein
LRDCENQFYNKIDLICLTKKIVGPNDRVWVPARDDEDCRS